LHRFHALVAESMLSTNVSADKVLAFDQAGAVLDTRRFHIQQAAGDETVGLATFANRQGDMLVRREGFEDLWEHGRTLVYGAVNAGGLGTEGRFGPFCLIVGEPAPAARNVAVCFPGDSAQRYTTDSGVVDEAAACAEAAEWDRRADMALVVRGDEALSEPDASWPHVVCRSDHYMEAVRRGPVPLDELLGMRLRSTYRARLDELQASALAGDDLDPDQSNEAGAYDVALKWKRPTASSSTMSRRPKGATRR